MFSLQTQSGFGARKLLNKKYFRQFDIINGPRDSQVNFLWKGASQVFTQNSCFALRMDSAPAAWYAFTPLQLVCYLEKTID